MNLVIEIENKEDYPFIKKLLESLKGVKIINTEYETIEGLPVHVFEEMEKYGKSLKDEDMISKKEFFKFIDEEICRLNSQK
jgi:formylmethanofuran dehydrogenase subunit B